MASMEVDWQNLRTRDGVKPDAAVLDVFVTSEDIDTVYDAYCRIEHAAFYNRDLEEGGPAADVRAHRDGVLRTLHPLGTDHGHRRPVRDQPRPDRAVGGRGRRHWRGGPVP